MKYLIGATFLSCEDKNRIYQVMGIEKGRIAYLGNTLPEYVSRQQVTDLEGKCVVPAFGDTHIHFESFALFNGTVDVRDAANFT